MALATGPRQNSSFGFESKGKAKKQKMMAEEYAYISVLLSNYAERIHIDSSVSYYMLLL
jgi:hypothetical protein